MLRVGIVCDMVEEGWPSMDLVGEMLASELSTGQYGVTCDLLRFPMKRRLSKVDHESRFSIDRFVNRFVDYPLRLRKAMSHYDVFHLVDHSYSHLLHILPAERTIVTCHDLDTFRSLLEPKEHARSVAFKMMTRVILSGFRRAAFVTCDSDATRSEIVKFDLMPSGKLAVVPLGVASDFHPRAAGEDDDYARRFVGDRDVCLLHVGSTVPRKQIEFLLRVVAEVKRDIPDVRLLRAGGPFSTAQQELARAYKLEETVTTLPHLSRAALAAVYRAAALVILPSSAEGFGLPVVEALACGTPVVASDLPVLREAGGDAASYCTVGDVEAWRRTVVALLEERVRLPERWRARRARALRQAAQFTWSAFAANAVAAYKRVGSA